jgi:hypothetical protein
LSEIFKVKNWPLLTFFIALFASPAIAGTLQEGSFITFENHSAEYKVVTVNMDGGRMLSFGLKPKQWVILNLPDNAEALGKKFDVQILLEKSSYAKSMIGSARVVINQEGVPSMSYTEQLAGFPGIDGPLGSPIMVIQSKLIKDLVIQY